MLDPLRLSSVRTLALAAAAGLFLALTSGIVTLANQAFREIVTLNIAKSDNLQWTLAQTEVEFLSFYNELVRVDAGEVSQLPELRRWFDIFYSRINTLQTSRVYGQLTERERLVPAFQNMRQFLDETAILIDGMDADWLIAVPEIAPKAARLRPELRSVSLEGIRVFSQISDNRREMVADTMVRIASLTAGLIVLLLVGVFWLSRLYRFGRMQTLETQQTRDRLQAMLKTSLDAVLVVDRDGKFVEFSGSASEIFGYSADEAVGQDMTKLIFPPHLIDAHNRGMHHHLETGEEKLIGAGRAQVEARRKTGETFPVELSIAKTMSPQGEIFVSYLRDISDRREAEEKLLKARDEALAGERTKSRFIAVMSHEMRTPLNGLLGSLELLKTTPLNTKQAQLAEMMQNSGNLLLHHVNDVLDISKLESGKIGSDISDLNLDALIDEVLESQSALAKNKGLDLHYARGETDIGTLTTSAIGLRQILLNLVNNAIKFTEKGGVQVEASVQKSTQKLRIWVRDTGPGINPDNHARVFEDFVTLDSSFGRKADGTGLGLGIARRLVQALDGAIGIENHPKGGAHFWVEIPYLPAKKTMGGKKKVRAKPAIAPPLTPKDVLVVEDNQINRFVLREMLQADGHRVTEAHDGLAGLDVAAQRKFDAIFMDISMPRLDGIAATVRLRASGGPSANVPIIALTAHALPADRELFLASGMNAVLTKPIDQKRIAKVLQETAIAVKGAKKVKQQKATAQILNGAMDELIEILGPKKVQDLSDRFLQEGEAHLRRISALFDAADYAAAQAVVHSFAGSSATFGATGMQGLLAGMESDLKLGRHESARAALPRLGFIWSATKVEISARVPS